MRSRFSTDKVVFLVVLQRSINIKTTFFPTDKYNVKCCEFSI